MSKHAKDVHVKIQMSSSLQLHRQWPTACRVVSYGSVDSLNPNSTSPGQRHHATKQHHTSTYMFFFNWFDKIFRVTTFQTTWNSMTFPA